MILSQEHKTELLSYTVTATYIDLDDFPKLILILTQPVLLIKIIINTALAWSLLILSPLLPYQ